MPREFKSERKDTHSARIRAKTKVHQSRLRRLQDRVKQRHQSQLRRLQDPVKQRHQSQLRRLQDPVKQRDREREKRREQPIDFFCFSHWKLVLT